MNRLLPALALAALAAPAAAPAAPAPERRVVDRVAATVNGEVVTLMDLTDRVGDALERADAMPAGPARDRARADVLRRALEAVLAEKLLEGAAKEAQVEPTEEQVDAAVAEIKARNGFDDGQLDRALAEQGIDRARFREQLRTELHTMTLLQSKVRGRIRVTEEDVRSYYTSHPGEFSGVDEVLVRHIFLPLDPAAPPLETSKARARAEDVLRRLRAGEPFDRVAREVSQGPSASEGGELGWIRRGTIEKTLEDVAFGLKKGEVSGVVRAGPGLHVLKVEDRRVGGGKTFDEVKDQIRDRLTMEQGESARQQYVAELRKTAAIDVRLPELREEAQR